MSSAYHFVDLAFHAFYGIMRRLRRRRLARENLRWERPDPLAGGRSLQALARDYFFYDLVAGFLCFLLAPPLVLLWLGLFQAMGLWFTPDPGASERLLRPGVWAWALPALFAGLACLAPLMHLLMKPLLAERYAEYIFYARKLAGFDVVLVVKALTALIAVAALCGALLFSSTFTAFLDDRIVIKPVLGEPRSYGYGEIVTIRSVPAGDQSDRKPSERRPGHYEILFRDGTLWRSTDGLRDSLPACDYRALSWAAARAGKRITGPDIRLGEHARCD